MLSFFILSMFVSVGKIIPLLATGQSGNSHPILDAASECFVATNKSITTYRLATTSSVLTTRVVPSVQLLLGPVTFPPWILRGFAPTGPPPLRQKAVILRRNHHPRSPSCSSLIRAIPPQVHHPIL